MIGAARAGVMRLGAAPPTLSAVTETGTAGMPYGPAAGGISVTLSGVNLGGSPTVTFGGTPATSVAVINSTTLTCVIPAKPAGVQNCVVTTAGGSSSPLPFTYIGSATLSGNIILVDWGRHSSSGTRSGGAASLRHGTYTMAPGTRAFSIAPNPVGQNNQATLATTSQSLSTHLANGGNDGSPGLPGFSGGFFGADGWSAGGGSGAQNYGAFGSTFARGLGGAKTGGDGALIGTGAGVGNGLAPGGGAGGSWSTTSDGEIYNDGPGHAGGAGLIKFSYSLGSAFAEGGVKSILSGHVVHTLTALSGNVIVY